MILGVAGMVGTGKTTLTRALADRFGLQMALESVDAENPWLESFYRQPRGHAPPRASPPAAFPGHPIRQHAADARNGRQLGAGSDLVRGRRDLRAGIVRTGPADFGRVVAVPASLRRAVALARRPTAATPHL